MWRVCKPDLFFFGHRLHGESSEDVGSLSSTSECFQGDVEPSVLVLVAKRTVIEDEIENKMEWKDFTTLC